MIGLAFALLLTGAVATGADAAPAQTKVAFHVHTTWSTGERSLDEVLAEARRRGIGAVVLTENLLVRFEYGLFPLRGVVRKVVEKPSVGRGGIDRYLAAVEAAQRRFPDVTVVPGVEVIPYYYWTGSPFTHDLTMWDAQRNLLVVGLARPEDYATLPAIGHGGSPLSPAVLWRFALAAGVLGGGVALLVLRRERTVRLRHFTVRVRRRYRLGGAAVVLAGLFLLADAFGASQLDPYGGSRGSRPYQALIDAAEARGGLTFWSFPEARDLSRQTLTGWGTVTLRTDPHPDLLVATRGYTGFGAAYADTVTVTEPGRQWDRVLLDYAEGRRPRPAWGVGEVGYHGPPKALDEALTVLWTSDRSRPAVLRALGSGQFYALTSTLDYHLVLDDFSIRGEGTETGTPMGGELRVDGQEPLLLAVRLSADDGREVPVTARLVRSGRVVAELAGTTPLERLLRLEPPAPGGREFFRLEVTRPHRLLGNPIFVRRTA